MNLVKWRGILNTKKLWLLPFSSKLYFLKLAISGVQFCLEHKLDGSFFENVNGKKNNNRMNKTTNDHINDECFWINFLSF